MGEKGLDEDEEGNVLDEPVVVADGRLGWGADVDKVLAPTVVPGLQVDYH